MFAGEVHDLRHLGLRNFVREDPALADTVVVYVHHDLKRDFLRLVEEFLDDVDDELLGSVVVVQQENPVEARSLGLRLGAGDDCGSGPAVIRTTRFAWLVCRPHIGDATLEREGLGAVRA